MFTSTDQLIECVPNFSEGRNQQIIAAIAASISKIDSIKLMNIDIGFDANRTVFTFAGKPAAVEEAAFQSVKIANELIDMRAHIGEHPRMGACDVFPMIPLQNISMKEVVEITKQVGKRIGEELNLPVYLYEHSATKPERKNLAYLRKGEYESIKDKINLAEWKPDFGEQKFNEKFGMMALGARNFLIAYNINLTTKDEAIAKSIAKQIRILRENKDGSFESNLVQNVKAIGWFMQEFNCAQVSMNITDIEKSPIIEVFSLIKKMANEIGADINGSELIGLIPLRALGRINNTIDLETKIIFLGLNAVKPFDMEKNIIEYNLGII